jgi:hypothetical protein
MPITQATTTTFPDHRIFGLDQRGQLRANLHNSAASRAPGALYSWTWAPTVKQLAGKLSDLWEQPLSDNEFEVLEQLEASNSEFEIDCDECLATGVDPGGLSAVEPEECPVCHGAKRMTIASVYTPGVAA